MDEFALIERILRPQAGTRADVVLGIGDDGAVVAPRPGESLVIVADTLVADVHFPSWLAAEDVGYRAVAVNLSDVAAMGAEPRWATLALTLPQADEPWLRRFAAGLNEALAVHGCALVGGDTTRGPLTVTVQIVGGLPAGTALERGGARPGDDVWVSGTLGDAALGLDSPPSALPDEHARHLRARLARPTPRVALGAALRGVAASCIDVSDGLLADLGHVAARSACALRIEVARLPLSPAARAHPDRLRVRDAALAGGDDYELAFTAPADRRAAVESAAARAGCEVARIGIVEAGPGVVVAVDEAGCPVPVARAGFRHFAG